MPQNFFITGLPKTGKTTLLRTIIKELRDMGISVGGFISPEEKHAGKRTGFLVQDIESGKTGMLADVDADGPKVSKYHVDIGSFETIAMMSLSDFERYDAIVIDEIGYMECKSSVFLDALDRILDSKTVLIASLHEDMVDRYSAFGKVYEIGETNRQSIYKEILSEIKAITKKPERAVKEKPAKKAKKTEPTEEKPLPERKEKPVKASAKKGKKAAAKKAAAPIKEKAPAKKEEQDEPAPKAKQEPAKKEKKGLFRNLRDLVGI
jgi:nucleoside-triphosphatase THEP1